MAITTKTQALKKLYKAIIGEDTTKNDPTKIICDLADNWSGGGGGGSSDFSTATVTVVNNTDDYVEFYFPKIISLPSGTYTEATSPNGDPHTTEELVIALAEDGCIVLPTGISGNIAVSGDASISDRGMIIITGDCTITIS